jgi:hypothetical protein
MRGREGGIRRLRCIARLRGDSKEREASYALEFGCELIAVIGSYRGNGGVHGALRRQMLRHRRCASAGAATRALSERGGRILIKEGGQL